MSNIANKNNTYGSSYNVTIANGTEEQIGNLEQVNIYNSIIISIPQENGVDQPKNASVWMTDNSGKLYEISKPISSFDKLEKRIHALENAHSITPDNSNIIDESNNT